MVFENAYGRNTYNGQLRQNVVNLPLHQVVCCSNGWNKDRGSGLRGGEMWYKR